MKPVIRAIAVGCVLATTVSLLPAEAMAQGRRRAVGRAGPAVVVRPRVVVARAYYRPLFYNPWYGAAGWGGAWGGAWGGGWGYPGWGYPGYYGGGAFYDGSASVRLQVFPREAEVFVDGYFAGVVDSFDGVFQRLRVAPGDHDIELYLPGYRSIRQRLYLQPGVTSHVRLEMEPLGPGDAQSVRPEGAPRADVSPRPRTGAPIVNEPPAPRAPRAPRQPDPQARDRGDADRQEVVPIENGFGELALRVQPADATVLVDGEEWQGPAGDERLMLQVGTGAHRLEVRKDGYRSYLTEITVRDGQTTALNIALTRQ